MTSNRGQGKAAAWLIDNVGHAGDECLIWPFSTNGTGYGRLGYNGVGHYAHRFMCELAHGAPPSPIHEAAHSCGNGMGSCVNPRHLEWKTPSENQLDRRRHGTAATSIWGNKGKLTREQGEQIIALKGQKTQRVIAEMFGCHFQTVSRLHKNGLKTVYKSKPFLDEENDALISFVRRGMHPRDIAKELGRTHGSVHSRLCRLRREQRS